LSSNSYYISHVFILEFNHPMIVHQKGPK